jgi:hypothetical protein
MTTQDESENSFAPLSDTDLASILEAQLAQMRGTRVAPRVDVPAGNLHASDAPAWTDELFDAPTQEMTATEVTAVREPVFAAPAPLPAPTPAATFAFAFSEPMMFSPSEMQRLRGQASGVSHSVNALPLLPVVAQPSDIEQQLVQVFAEIQALELAKGQRVLEPETALVAEVVGTAEAAEAAEAVETAENSSQSAQDDVVSAVKPSGGASLSFDDILFGTSSEE